MCTMVQSLSQALQKRWYKIQKLCFCRSVEFYFGSLAARLHFLYTHKRMGGLVQVCWTLIGHFLVKSRYFYLSKGVRIGCPKFTVCKNIVEFRIQFGWHKDNFWNKNGSLATRPSSYLAKISIMYKLNIKLKNWSKRPHKNFYKLAPSSPILL